MRSVSFFAILVATWVSVIAEFPGLNRNGTANPGRNSFPKKVTWGYYFLGHQPYQSPATIIAQGVNYVCISFGNIGSEGTFAFPGGGCAGPDTEYCQGFMKSNGTAAAPTGPAFFQQLHDAGVTISITVGGAGASVPGPGTDPEITLSSFKSVLEGWSIYDYVDGIDFDWENSGAGPAINNLAPAFKNAGYVVTSAPMASQLHGGCGYKWQEDDNQLSDMDFTNMDGILVQWYQGACENLGHCPHAQCGKSPGLANCFDMDFSVQILKMLSSGPGACTKSGKQNGQTFANCSGVLDTCKQFPLEKIAIGVGLYYQVGQSQGLITAQNVLDLDKQLDYKLLGAGAWDINFGFADPRSNPFFKDLATAWSGPTPSPTPSPPTPTPTPTPPVPTPTPPPPTPSPSPSNCAAAWGQCGGTDWKGAVCCSGTCTCQGTPAYSQCKPETGKWQC